MREVQPTFIARSKPYRDDTKRSTVCDRCGIDYERNRIACQICFDNRHCADCRSLVHNDERHTELTEEAA